MHLFQGYHCHSPPVVVEHSGSIAVSVFCVLSGRCLVNHTHPQIAGLRFMPMQDIIAKRLKSHMDKLKLSALELARKADVKPSFIYDILNGKSTNPSTVRLARVAEHLGISLAYLAGQEDTQAPGNIESPLVSLATLSVKNGDVITTQTSGEPYYFHNAWIKSRLDTAPENLRLLFVEGDSMAPALCHGDMLLIDCTRHSPSPPGIFVLFDGMGLTAKRLELVSSSTPPMVRITSDNPQYEASQQPLEDLDIVGRVVWFAREM